MPAAPLTMSRHLKRALHVAGSALALAGMLFVGVRLHAYWLKIDISQMTLARWSTIAFLALCYGAANWFLAFAWWHILNHLGAVQSRLCAVRLYGLSNLAKYVPGNIFHLAGRQALGMAASLPTRILARSMVWELGLIAFCGALFSAMMLPRWWPDVPEQAGILLVLASFLLLAAALHTFVGRQAMLASLWQLLFLIVSGAVFVALVALLHAGPDTDAPYWLRIGGAYIVAWLAGLVTPGAPAGVGIREVVLLFLLQGLVTQESMVMAVLLGRVITVIGDVLFFAMAFCIPPTLCLSSKKYA